MFTFEIWGSGRGINRKNHVFLKNYSDFQTLESGGGGKE